ncbi:MAG: N-6 DNA methylase, partial [Thermoplasmata archaeon]
KDVSEEELEDIVGYPIKIPVDCYWHQAVSKQNLTKSIVDALRKIAEVNTQIKDAINFFLEAYLNRLVGEPSIDIALRDVVNIFNSVDFGELETDILGDAYEWLISYFAPQKAKAGELFTPREIVELLVRLLDPNKERNKILDPAAGSGGMLIYAYKYVKNNYGEDVAKELKLVGQELKDINYAILVLNFVLHGIPLDNPNVKLYRGDSLLNPLFRNEKFDIVIFNPPWNQDGYGEENLAKSTVKEYFIKYGYPPNNSADWAWIVLAINSVNENGKVGIVIDQGCLFRGGKEKELRKKIIEEDLIECVISTPPKLFYNTGAPAAIIIFNKNKPTERKNKILFIDASNYYEDHPEVRRLDRLSKEGIDKIVNAYKNFVEEKGFSKIVDITEIIKNDYNLNVSLYITPVFDEEFSIEDLSKEISEYFKLREELREIEEKLINHVKEIVRL